MYELSVVVSIYNIENYLCKCIDSLLDQSDIKYEILLINDGSTDLSGDICQEYAKKFEFVKYYNKINGGLSSARNYGLNKSNGKYIFFVDGDDYIEKDSLKTIINNMENNNLDIMQILYKEVTSNGKTIKNHDQVALNVNKVYNASEWISSTEFKPMAWMYIFNKKFLNDNKLYFFEGIYHEDTEFTPRAISLANRIMILNKYVYNYVIRDGSIMRTVNMKKSYDLITVGEKLRNFKRDNKLDKEIDSFIDSRIAYSYWASLSYVMEHNVKIKSFFNEYKNAQYVINNNMIKCQSFKYRVIGILIKLKLYYLVELIYKVKQGK